MIIYQEILLLTVGLSMLLSFVLFRFLESVFKNRVAKKKVGFFYGYAFLVFALAALMVSWMKLYRINLFIGIPVFILVFLCRNRASKLKGPGVLLKISALVALVALAVGLSSYLFFK